MAIKNKNQRGFALLIAVIFMSVMLSLGLALSSIGYKQAVLASSAIESQYAFYAADAALECALYADQGLGQNIFAYDSNTIVPTPSIPSFLCDNNPPYLSPTRIPTGKDNAAAEVFGYSFSLDNKHCADVTIYKYSFPQTDGVTTRIFSQGYDVSCATVANPGGARFVSRGIKSSY